MSSTSADRVTPVVVGAAALLFAASAYTIVASSLSESQLRGRASSPRATPADVSVRPAPKLSSHSAVAKMTYVTRPDDCEAFTPGSTDRPKIHAGALLKLIDIAAGVCARRHSGQPCVTISVDSVILLKPIYLGDLVHVSASVNRAWDSSMEVGVRIIKETLMTSQLEYVSHSYLTFVSIAKPAPSAASTSLSARTWSYFFGNGAAGKVKPPKPLLAAIQPTSRLESRRHMLAGRRRNKRLEDAKQGRTREGVSIAVKRQVREELQTMLREHDHKQHMPAGADRSDTLRAIEMEVLIQAWAQGDESVQVRDGLVQVHLPGDEALQFPEDEVRAHAKLLGIKMPGDARFDPSEYRLDGTATPTWAAQASSASPLLQHKRKPRLARTSSSSSMASIPPPPPRLREVPPSATDDMPVADTLTTSMHIVFPQHTNSHGLTFGGNTMSWCEEVAIMACRVLRVSGTGARSWKTVSMDGLEFNVQVGVGELMLFSALVVRTYAHSCEVYVLAQAENRQGDRRFTNDVLFTMAYCARTSREADAIDPDEDHGGDDHITTQIVMPPNSALAQFAEASSARRQQRLELRQMLLRVYGS